MEKEVKSKRVIQVISFSNREVVHELDVTGKTDRQIDKIDRGLNINLNHSEYYTLIVELTTR